MNVHTIIWFVKRLKNNSKVTKPIFVAAMICMTFFIIHSLNWATLIIIDWSFPLTNAICIYQWQNDIFYLFGKVFMYLFFCIRLYNIFSGSIYEVNRIILFSLAIFSLVFFIAIIIDIIIDMVRKYNKLNENGIEIDNISDCGMFSDLFVGLKLYDDNNSFLNITAICIIAELIISAILLRLLVSRLLKLYIKQKVTAIVDNNLKLKRIQRARVHRKSASTSNVLGLANSNGTEKHNHGKSSSTHITITTHIPNVCGAVNTMLYCLFSEIKTDKKLPSVTQHKKYNDTYTHIHTKQTYMMHYFF